MSTSPRGSLDGARRVSERRRTGSSASAQDRKKRETNKVDQIVSHLFSKTVHIILEARLSVGAVRARTMGGPGPSAEESVKTDKWFNIEMEDYDFFRDELKTWKGVSSLLFSTSDSPPSSSFSSTHTLDYTTVPTLVLEVLLDLSDVPHHRCLVIADEAGQLQRIDAVGTSSSTTRRRHITLERWVVSLAPPMPPPPGPELPTVYRHAIAHMRALYTQMRLLPVWGLQRRLRKGGTRDAGAGVLKLGCRLSTAGDEGNEIGVDEPLMHDMWADVVESFSFEPVQTPLGSLHTSVTYRTKVNFSVADTEAMLSSRFIDEDFFRPVAADQPQRWPQRPGSVPVNRVEGLPLAPAKPEPGSLSSGRLLNFGSRGKAGQTEGSPPESSLTAAIRAAGATPAFLPRPPGNTAQTGSALTARLMGTWNSTSPTAGPFGSPKPVATNMLRTRSEGSNGPLGISGVPFADRPASPTSETLSRQVSSSPHSQSGPSSSLRIAAGQRGYTAISAPPLSPGTHHLPSSIGPSGASSNATVAPKPMPVMRRYSSRASRSYGQSSSSGSIGGGAGGADLGSLRSRAKFGFDNAGGGLGMSPQDVYSTSLGKASLASAGSMEGKGGEKEEIEGLIAMIESNPTLRKTPTSMNRFQVDQALKKLTSSFHSTEGVVPSGSSPAGSPDSASGTRPHGSWRLTSLGSTSRPTSALDGLQEEDEPGEPNAPKPAFAPSSLGKPHGVSLPRQSPLSGSPAYGTSFGSAVPFPRYVSRRRVSMDATHPGAALAAAVGEPSSARSGSPGPPSAGLVSSFEDGPVGKLELSLGDSERKART